MISGGIQASRDAGLGVGHDAVEEAATGCRGAREVARVRHNLGDSRVVSFDWWFWWLARIFCGGSRVVIMVGFQFFYFNL